MELGERVERELGRGRGGDVLARSDELAEELDRLRLEFLLDQGRAADDGEEREGHEHEERVRRVVLDERLDEVDHAQAVVQVVHPLRLLALLFATL